MDGTRSQQCLLAPPCLLSVIKLYLNVIYAYIRTRRKITLIRFQIGIIERIVLKTKLKLEATNAKINLSERAVTKLICFSENIFPTII